MQPAPLMQPDEAASLRASCLIAEIAPALASARRVSLGEAARIAMAECAELRRAYGGDPAALPAAEGAVAHYKAMGAFTPSVLPPASGTFATTGPRVALSDDDFETYGQRLCGVEIFRVGTWNGHKYEKSDLDEIVTALGFQGFRPPVKLGHDERPDAPAYGWVENLRREGDVLVADFDDVPDELVEQIKQGRYDAVSAEVYFDLKRNGTIFKKALRAVAIIGAHPPAVSNLRPLRSALPAAA